MTAANMTALASTVRRALQAEFRAKDAAAPKLELDGRYFGTVAETTTDRPGVAYVSGWDIDVFPSADDTGFHMVAQRGEHRQEFWITRAEVEAASRQFFDTFAYAIISRRVGPQA